MQRTSYPNDPDRCEVIERLSTAIVYPGDCEVRRLATRENNRFAALVAAFAAHGVDAHPAVCDREQASALRDQLLGFDVEQLRGDLGERLATGSTCVRSSGAGTAASVSGGAHDEDDHRESGSRGASIRASNLIHDSR